jgi:hypothetical protein
VGPLALWGLYLSPGCGSSSPSTSGPPATFTQIYAEIFPLGTKGQCNYCHDRPANEISNGKLDMGHTQADAYTAIVGTTSASAKCGGGRHVVIAGDSSASLFFLKLEAMPSCGDRMPQGGTPLTDAQLEMVRSWIAAGAKND